MEMRRMPSLRAILLAGLILGPLTACDTGPERGEVQVLMARSGSAAANVMLSVGSDGVPGDVPPDAIASIVIKIDRVDLKPLSARDEGDVAAAGEGEAEATEEDHSGWIRVGVGPEAQVDLLTLPTSGGEAVAEGEVTATTYKEIRLLCAAASSLTLAEDVSLPNQTVIAAGTYDLRVPSCESSGLKIKGGTFVVPEGGEEVVVLELTTDATIQNLTWDGGGFRMNPVMKIR